MSCESGAWGAFSGSQALDVCGLTDDGTEGAIMWREYVELHNAMRKRLQSGDAEVPSLIYECSDEHCGGWGFGDVANGLASTMYFAIMSKRAFFVKLDRNGQDVLQLLDMPHIDVRLPAKLEGRLRDGSCERLVAPFRRVQDVLGRELAPPCTVVQSNTHPASQLWSHGSLDGRKIVSLPDNVDAFSTTALTQIQPEYATGCAFNFLFRPSARFLSVAEASERRMRGRPYVAVHARLPDRWSDKLPAWSSADGKTRPEDELEAAVQGLLRCANSTGWRLHSDGAFGIYFASSDPLARQAASSVGARIGLPVHMSDEEPEHALHASAFESYMVDLWMLMHASGMVRSALFAFGGASSFSRLAVEVALMPWSRAVAEKVVAERVERVAAERMAAEKAAKAAEERARAAENLWWTP